MRRLILATTALVILASHARAADPELSTDTKRMLAYGTLAVMTGACKTQLTPSQSERMNDGLAKASEAQKDLSEEDFTEMMKAAGAQVGQNREAVCSALTPEFIETSLSDAAAGR